MELKKHGKLFVRNSKLWKKMIELGSKPIPYDKVYDEMEICHETILLFDERLRKLEEKSE
jgi:hypothetical protein